MSTKPSSPNFGPIPLHAVSHAADGTELVVKRRPGRPKVVRPQPTADEARYIEEVNEARGRHIERDALVEVIRHRTDADRVLGTIIEALARESASLLWEIRQGREAGKDTAQLSSRRIDALCKIGLIQLGRVKLGLGRELSPGDPQMRVVIDFFVGTVAGVLESSLPCERAERLRAMVDESLRAWATGHS